MARTGIKAQPINKVHWIQRDELCANDYNPNVVARPELRLLKISIMEDGWTQPIVCLPDKTIVDGFHRWTVSGDPDVSALTGGKVPVVFVELDQTHRMMSTIRHNRARGQHVVKRMADIVKRMVSDGVAQEEIEQRLQMEDEEVERLACRVGLPKKVIERNPDFGKAWRPERTSSDK